MKTLLFAVAVCLVAACGDQTPKSTDDSLPPPIEEVAHWTEATGLKVWRKDAADSIHLIVLYDGGSRTFSGSKAREDAINAGIAKSIEYKANMFQLGFGPHFEESFGMYLYSGGAEAYSPEGKFLYRKE